MSAIASKIFNPQQKYVCEVIRNKYGLVLDEKEFLKSQGTCITFYWLGKKPENGIFQFDSWDEVQDLAFYKDPNKKKKTIDPFELGRILNNAERLYKKEKI